jgi:hypothetical protein
VTGYELKNSEFNAKSVGEIDRSGVLSKEKRSMGWMENLQPKLEIFGVH